jgi:hypothetical protein
MSTPSCAEEWAEQNQAYLVREFDALRRRLESAAAQNDETPDHEPMTAPAAIDLLAQRFDLSPFEREILLLCAGVEMDSALAAWCAQAIASASVTR